MSPIVQAASIAAWSDEKHVVENRALYRKKFAQVTPLLAGVMEVALPDAGFYLWAKVPEALGMDDAEFARALLAQYNVTVLPGSYLAREAQEATLAPNACAWPWWPKPKNAWRLHCASCSSSKPARPDF